MTSVPDEPSRSIPKRKESGAHMAISRRQFINQAGGVAAAAVTGFPAVTRAAGLTWGGVPAGVWPTAPDLRILEIHLLGGIAPFESFYFRPGSGLQTRGFDSEITALPWNAACTGFPSGIESMAHGLDTGPVPKMVHLGPFARPLWPAHISSRLRVIVQSHDLLPHEAAIPFVMTGQRLGRSNQASLGSAIQHRYRALDEAAGFAPRVQPYSYGLLPQAASLNSLLFSMMGALGTHPGNAKPLVLRIGNTFGDFLTQLQRNDSSTEGDALLDQLRGQYRDRLRFQGLPDPAWLIRSKGFQNYDVAVSNLLMASSLSTFLGGLPSTIGSDFQCASEVNLFNSSANPTRTALETAVDLLTRPPDQAPRYVHVVDSGLTRSGLPYDVHGAGHATDTGSNLFNTLSNLARLIRDPANPSPDDAGKIDLNNTMIHITTDFGRTPFKSLSGSPSAGSLGRDHWPQAFCSVLIGGPAAAGVIGSISDAANLGAVADASYSPSDVRAAMLVAMNIDPFEPENYAQGQLSSEFSLATDHTAAMIALKQKIIGVV